MTRTAAEGLNRKAGKREDLVFEISRYTTFPTKKPSRFPAFLLKQNAKRSEEPFQRFAAGPAGPAMRICGRRS
jgi:hypothetical protein